MSADFLLAEPLQLPDVAHGFFTRNGGVSTGAFASLNCSLSGKDNAAAVRENRTRAAAALGLSHGALCGLTQVHGKRVVVAEEAWPEDQRPEADGVVTRRAGLALGIITGDCAPVLAMRPMRVFSLRASAQTAGNLICPAIVPHGLVRLALPSACWRMTRWRMRRGFSAIGAIRWPVVGRLGISSQRLP